MSRTGPRSQPAALVSLLGVALALAACSASSQPAPPPGSSPELVATASLAADDTRLLLGQGNVLADVTLSGRRKEIVTLETHMSVIELALSPSGRQIAFVVELAAYTGEDGQLDFGADVYVSNLDGSNLHLLLQHDSVGDYFEAPAWLDDSTLLVGWRGFDEGGGSNRIERVDVTSGSRTVVLQDAAMGALSPDRRSIVYTAIDRETRVQRLVVEDIAAQDTPRVLVDENDGLALFSAVAFSPDASLLAFAAVDLADAAPPPMPPGYVRPIATTLHPFAQDIWLIDLVNGGGPRRLADIAENMPSTSWSGDGSSLYVVGPGFLWRLDPKTGEAESLQPSGRRGAVLWLEGR